MIVPSIFQKLPLEIKNLIVDDLSRDDLISLCSVSKSYCNNFIVILSYKCSRCIHQIEKGWNSMVPYLEENAKKMFKDANDPYHYRYQPTYHHQSDAENHDVVYCKVFPGEEHRIKVAYAHNPRDVDMIAWYLDDRIVGYKML